MITSKRQPSSSSTPSANAHNRSDSRLPSIGILKVLGPTEAETEGHPVDLGGPLPRRLLTALIAAEGTAVADERLMEFVWGQDRPAQAVAALRAYTSRLRRTLGSHGGTALRRQGCGYALRLAPDATDVARFVRDVEVGRGLVAAGRAADAMQTLTEALSLWRGEPYADLGDFAELAATRGELVGLRESATEERLAARLATGDNLGAVSELETAIRRNPYRERLWELLILGLYRAGRQGDALAALRRVRTQLADELGIEPGPRLRELERQVLGQDTELLPRAGGPDGPRGTGMGWPISSFHGRERDLDTLVAAVRRHRLVTVVGPAGVGKTRLAVEYLATCSDSDGPWLARLADVGQPAELAHAVADAVGAADLAGDPQLALVRALHTRRGLLILDNCEHLVESVAELTQRLLGHCLGLRILATSRETLALDGEVLLPAEPLHTHTDDDTEPPAVTLFIDRVRTVRPDWTPSPTEYEHAKQICVALDGLPLAIELAAARARHMGLGEIAQRLDDRFTLLGAIPRGSLAPHTTMRAAIARGIDQLAAPERALLSRLWPFEGGFCLEAADAVRPTNTPTMDSLSTLVARSMLTADTTTPPTRYRMLRTQRAYCQDQDPHPAETHEAHAQWVRDLVKHRAAEFRTHRAGHAMRHLTRELPNLRVGIAHDLTHKPLAALRTVSRLNWFWARGGHGGEALRLLDTALRVASDATPLDLGYARLAQTTHTAMPQDPGEVLRCYDDILAWSATSNDHAHRMLHGLALSHLAMNLIRTQAAEAAHEMSRKTIEAGQQLEQQWLIAGGELTLGAALLQQRRSREGRSTLRASIHRATRCGYVWAAGCALLFHAWDTLRDTTSPTDPKIRGQQALIQLQLAFNAFQSDADQFLSLTALDTAAPALGLLGNLTDAIRLRAGAHRHAEALGTSCDFFQWIGAVMGDLPPIHTPSPAQCSPPPLDAPAMSWSAMVKLLNTSSQEVDQSAR